MGLQRVRHDCAIFTHLDVGLLDHESESHSIVSDSQDPMDYTVHGILQARILEWVAFPFSRGSSQPTDQTLVSHIAGGFLYQLSHKGSPGILEWVA